MRRSILKFDYKNFHDKIFNHASIYTGTFNIGAMWLCIIMSEKEQMGGITEV